jgi:hypothetical protein
MFTFGPMIALVSIFAGSGHDRRRVAIHASRSAVADDASYSRIAAVVYRLIQDALVNRLLLVEVLAEFGFR